MNAFEALNELWNSLGIFTIIIILLFKGGQISIVPFRCERKADSEYIIAAAGPIVFI